MNTKKQLLLEELAKLSEGVDLNSDELLSQWEPHMYLEGDFDCLCTTHFNTGMTIKNKLNGNVADIGNVCIDYFEDDRLKEVVKDIKHQNRKVQGIAVRHRKYAYIRCTECNKIFPANDILIHTQLKHLKFSDSDHRVMASFVNYAYNTFFKPKKVHLFTNYESYKEFCNNRYKRYKQLPPEQYKKLFRESISSFGK